VVVGAERDVGEIVDSVFRSKCRPEFPGGDVSDANVGFPFAAEFWYTFPGYLPNGRMAMAVANHHSSPPSLSVITFDKEGKQTEEVLAVPGPDEMLAIPVKGWYLQNERLKEHLVERISFQPGFIRIRGCHFPLDDSYYRSPSWDHQDVGGLDLDTEDAMSWQEYPRGIGGEVSYSMRIGQYVFGWDRYADKRGRVHST
jgi:hypothetical protein